MQGSAGRRASGNTRIPRSEAVLVLSALRSSRVRAYLIPLGVAAIHILGADCLTARHVFTARRSVRIEAGAVLTTAREAAEQTLIDLGATAGVEL